jgi:UDP-glucose 4-epimerase
MNKKWIVTGCNGYLGSRICQELFNSGYLVLGVARNLEKIPKPLKKKIKCVTYNELSEALRENDIFIHCAGKTGSDGNFDDFKRTNVDWTLDLFELAAHKKLSSFIYISSIAALGYRNRGENNILIENDVPLLHEYEFYGRSKLLAEKKLFEKKEGLNLNLFILRPGFIYGKRNQNNKQSWLKRGFIVEPDSIFPLVHINNFCDALVRVGSSNEKFGCFFVVDEEQPTIKDYFNLKQELGIIKYRPWVIGVKKFKIIENLKNFIRPLLKKKSLSNQELEVLFIFQTRKLIYSTDLIKKLGWTQKISLIDGLKEELNSNKLCITENNKDYEKNRK